MGNARPNPEGRAGVRMLARGAGDYQLNQRQVSS